MYCTSTYLVGETTASGITGMARLGWNIIKLAQRGKMVNGEYVQPAGFIMTSLSLALAEGSSHSQFWLKLARHLGANNIEMINPSMIWKQQPCGNTVIQGGVVGWPIQIRPSSPVPIIVNLQKNK